MTLTLDRYVQWVAERELRTAVDRYQARGGTVVVLDPHSGAILALASVPTFRFDDPNLYSRANVALFNIPAVNQAAEPGSLFRLISFAAALDSGSIAPDTSFVNTGTLTYLGGSVRDSSQRSPGPETMSQALALSSEVGTTWAAARVGAPNFYRYARAFGLGQSTNSGLPGEVGGLLRLPADADWLPFDLITNAYGQGVWATPLQMTVAFAAIANGGTMMKPYVVQKIWGSAGDRAYFPTIEGQVIRKETASSLTRMLVATVDGTTHDQASAARVPGYAVAGAEGITPGANDGSAGATPELVSFAGYAPANAPRFVIVVWIVAPRQVPSGEAAAAPVFQSIAQQLLNYYQIPPSVPRQNNGM